MIQAVIFDWAGTTVDYGCFAPVQAFQEAFAHHGVPVTLEETRKPMGMLKRDHIRTMLRMERIARAWEETKAATEKIRLPGECAGCRLKEVCHACAAMCVTETGRFDVKPEYVCRMTHETVRRTIEEAENGNS